MGNLVLHNISGGYTCLVSSFAVFVSEREIKISKSPVVKAFESIKTEEAFMNLNLPIKNVKDASEASAINKAYEIDLSSIKLLEKALGVAKLDCFPILWVISNPSKIEWTIEF